MKDRIEALPQDLASVKTDVAVLRSNFLTRADLHRELRATTWKIIAAITVMCGAVFWIARSVEPEMKGASAPPVTASAAK